MPASLDPFRQWIGKKQSHSDTASSWPVGALAATLDRHEPLPAAGTEIPPGWHWLYFLEMLPASELGPDGHEKRGGFLPPVELPRRMWAGGRIEFLGPIRVGDALLRESEIISIEAKQGKSGRLVFVTVRHTVSAGDSVAVIEEHDIVYREAARSGDQPAMGKLAPAAAAWRREIVADQVMLFRFSALIFNAHRIHYDIDFCREAGYRGLLVHGPLLTLLLLDLCRRHETRPVRRIEYRALHPVYHGEKFTVNGVPSNATAKLWIADAAGICATQATASF